jgi:hypothetical protein
MRSGSCSIIAILMAIGCGSGTKSNTPGYGGATGQQCGTASPACISCITQNCNSEAIDVFGGGYMNNQFNGGQCPNITACACTSGNSNMDTCAQQGGSGCATAFAALGACFDANPCSTACTGNKGTGGNGGSNGLTVNGNSMNFGNVELGTQQNLCMVVSGPNASIIIPQVLNDTGCAAGGCAFSAQPLNCTTSDSCSACVTFAPKYAGAVYATLSIASGLTVALSGVGTASINTGTGGTSGTGGATGQQCLPSSDCLACITQNCDSQTTVAFGAGYVTGNLGGGGLCPTFMVCSDCTHSDHNAACVQQDGAGCLPALDAFNACFNSSCCTVCTGKSSCGDNSPGGGSCAAISMGNTSGSWTLQIIAQAGTDDVPSCSSPGQTLTVAVSGGSFSGPTSAVICGGATSSTFEGTISSSGTVTGVFSGSVPGGYIPDVCDIDACCSSPTSCATASNTHPPGACPVVILTKQ